MKIKQNTVGGEIKLNFRICVKNLKPTSDDIKGAIRNRKLNDRKYNDLKEKGQ